MKCFQEGKGNSDYEKEKEGANIKTASVKQLCGFENNATAADGGLNENVTKTTSGLFKGVLYCWAQCQQLRGHGTQWNGGVHCLGQDGVGLPADWPRQAENWEQEILKSVTVDRVKLKDMEVCA